MEKTLKYVYGHRKPVQTAWVTRCLSCSDGLIAVRDTLRAAEDDMICHAETHDGEVHIERTYFGRTKNIVTVYVYRDKDVDNGE